MSNPGRFLKKVTHCTQVHDMWPFGPLVYIKNSILLYQEFNPFISRIRFRNTEYIVKPRLVGLLPLHFVVYTVPDGKKSVTRFCQSYRSSPWSHKFNRWWCRRDLKLTWKVIHQWRRQPYFILANLFWIRVHVLARCMTWLISFAWAYQSCADRESSVNYKM